MLTEFEVRHSVLDIVMSQAVPTRKVRQLIQLSSVLKRESQALLHARALSAQAEDCNTAAHMDRLIRSLCGQDRAGGEGSISRNWVTQHGSRHPRGVTAAIMAEVLRACVIAKSGWRRRPFGWGCSRKPRKIAEATPRNPKLHAW
jgi:hypothetical protein